MPSSALKELGRLLGGADEVTPAPRRARRHVRGRRRPAHHPPDRGRVPELPRPDPGAASPTGSPSAASRCSTPCAACGCWPREATPVRLVMQARRARAGRHHPGRRPGPRGARRQVRGRRAHRGVQPRVPARRHRGHPGRRGHARDRRRPEAGAAPLAREHRLPLPADARPGLAERRSQRAAPSPLAHRLPVYTHAELHLAPGLTAVVGANGQGKTNLLEAIGYLATLSRSGAPRPRRWSAGAPRARWCGPRASARAASC